MPSTTASDRPPSELPSELPRESPGDASPPATPPPAEMSVDGGVRIDAADPQRPATIDTRAGAADLERLAAGLVTPRRLDDYTLTGRIARTSNALVYTATGGVLGDTEGVLKLTAMGYAPLLERELLLLKRCRDAAVEGVVRPLGGGLVRFAGCTDPDGRVVPPAVAIALPFLGGGDLAELIRASAASTGSLGAGLAARVGQRILAVQRTMLLLDRPIVHGDVKLQNVLLPYTDAPLAELTLIDLDSARELALPLARLAEAGPEVSEWLAEDVRAFGEVLYQVATGQEPSGSDGALASGNPAFDVLASRCFASYAGASQGYVCLADEGLRHDLQKALDYEARHQSGPRRKGFLQRVVRRIRGKAFG